MGLIKRVNFNVGEGLTTADLLNVQRFADARLLDALVAPAARDGQSPGSLLLDASYGLVLGASGRVYGNGNLAVRIAGGTLLQWQGGGTYLGAVTGLTPQLLPYLQSTAIDQTFSTVGLAAGQSRWDICCYRITDEEAGDPQTRDFEDAVTHLVTSQTFNKQLSTALEPLWVTGTPAATASAVEPAIPSGFAKLCAVRVDFGQTGAFGDAQLRDYRCPLGWTTGVVRANEMFWAGQFAAGGDFVVVGWIVSWAGGTPELYVPFPGPMQARCSHVRMRCKLAVGTTVQLGRLLRQGVGTISFAALLNLSPTFVTGAELVDTYSLSGTGVGAVGGPFWGGGLTGSPITTPDSQLALKITCNTIGDYIHFVEWGWLGP